MLGKYKLSGQSLTSIIIIILVVIGVVVYAVTHSNSHNGAPFTKNSELVFANSAQGQLYITDENGAQLSKTSFTPAGYLSVQAIAPAGGVLASLNTTTPQESFIFARSGTTKTFTGDAAAQLSSSVLAGSSHQFYFTGDSSMLLVSCPDANTDCSLNTLDLSSGDHSKLLDTGIKQTNKTFPVVYLVGYSPSQHSAYLRVSGKNKLGSSINGVYQVDINSKKVVRTIDLTALGNDTAVLSPDASKLAYTSVGAKNTTVINVLDIKSNKTQKIPWNQGLLSSQPGTLMWSPDSSKILFQTVNVVIPVSAGQTPPSVKLAYIDLSNNNSVTVLQEVKDPSHETIVGLGWVDKDSVVYQTQTAKTAYDFTNSTKTTLKQNITTKDTTTLKTPAGDLVRAAYY